MTNTVTIKNVSLEIVKGDITQCQVDAIVNAANSSLLGGGGVDGAIHRQGGLAILEECKRIRERQGGCDTGKAVFTTAGNLPCKYVIHTVGPIWNGGHDDEDALLASCYTESLYIIEKLKLTSVAFPNISTGVYNFPKDRAAKLALSAVVDFIKNQQLTTLTDIKFICFDDENFTLYQNALTNFLE